MNQPSANIDADTMTDILNLATWNRPRTSQELQSFIRTHHDSLPDDTEIE